MRVIVIADSFPCGCNTICGIYIKQQVVALRKYINDLIVINPIPYFPSCMGIFIKKWKKYTNIKKYETIDNAKIYHPMIIRLPMSVFSSLCDCLFYVAIENAIKNILIGTKATIINAHNMFPCGYAAMKISKKYCIPYIVTVHGQNFNYDIYHNKKLINKMKKIILNANRIIVVSAVLKKNAVEVFGDEVAEKIQIINNGIDENETVEAMKDYKESSSDKIMMLSVSSLIKSKGIDLNLAAINILIRQGDIKKESLVYYIIGDGEEKQRLQNYTNMHGLSGVVNFLGQIRHEDVMKYMRECDIFSLPSWREGFGIVYLEAMAFGKPVIGVVEQGIQDVIDHGKDGYLINIRNDSLQNILKRLIEDGELRKRIGIEARIKALKYYTWECNAIKYNEIFENILGKVL